MSELTSFSHAVGEANCHIQITVAYRRKIFEREIVRVLTRDYILAQANRYGITIAAINFGADHCHFFAADCKNLSIAKIANLLKGFSSCMMRRHHADLFKDLLWGKKFWSAGYFFRTVGAVNSATVQHYVSESQQKHWKISAGRQKKIIEF